MLINGVEWEPGSPVTPNVTWILPLHPLPVLDNVFKNLNLKSFRAEVNGRTREKN